MRDLLDNKVVLLDGRASGDEDLTPMLALLTTVLTQGGAQVQVFSLREMKLAHCIGRFACFVETPGICRYGEADCQAVLQAVTQSDTLILFTPVVFGGYSSQLKQIVDRFVSLILPSFRSYHGELHHVPRYAHFPRLVTIGVQQQLNAEDAALFKLVVGRNAINFHAPSYAAEVVSSTDDPDHLREVFQSLLERKDPFPWGDSVRSLMPSPDALAGLAEPDGARRACLIVGSPKTLSPSTSSVLGNALLERLKEHGWETESQTLQASLCRQQGQTALLAAVDRADLLLFAFPLYIDALPFLMTKALEVIADHRQDADHQRPQRLCAIANNGFVEAYQNHLALSICQRFAAETGMTWVGGLALGAGETICGGQPLKATGALAPVPCAHVISALDATGAALARGQAVPTEAVRDIARNPIPYTPFWIWRSLFLRGAEQWWERQAGEHGVSKQEMLAQPYARDTALEAPLPVS
jgi:multimeric flavodoxin WrbA